MRNGRSVPPHNNANMLCLGRVTPRPTRPSKFSTLSCPPHLKAAVTNVVSIKWKHHPTPAPLRLSSVDPEISSALFLEPQRQQENIELIASENFVSPAVMEAQARS